MFKKYLMLICFAIFILSGCKQETITDDTTKSELPLIEQPEPSMIVHMIGHDGLYRGYPWTAANSKLVIDPRYNEQSEFQRGDIVFFDMPDSEERSVKEDVARIVGLPGETLKVEKGQVYINGKKLDTFYGREWYNQYIEDSKVNHKEIKIGEGQYYLMPDVWFRWASMNAPVPKKSIKEK